MYENAESATLLQVGGRKGHHAQTTHGGLHAILKQSRAMLHEDTPSEVRLFMQKTLKEIEEDVYPLIHSQHENDQSVLNGFVDSFNTVISEYTSKKGQLEQLRTVENAESGKHKACRKSQLEKYFEVRKCKDTQDILFEDFKGKELTYKQDNQQYCGDVPVDLATDHAHYLSMKKTGEDYFEAWEAYETHRTNECVPKNTTYADQLALCDTTQVNLEAASCESHILHVTSWNNMVDQWQTLEANFQSEVHATQLNAESRLNEMHTLIEVACLLKKVDERGGKACTEADEEQVNAELDECQQAMNDAIPDLTLSIPEVPNTPEAPRTMPWACTEDFMEEQYSSDVLAVSAVAEEPHDQAAVWAETSLAKMPSCHACPIDEDLKVPEEHETAPIEGQATIQVGSISTDDTHIDGSSFVKAHTFQRVFAAKPVVVGFMTSNDDDSAQVQIFDVTRTGFKYAVVEPTGLDGPHGAETVNFIAAVPGVTEIGEHKVRAGIISTAHTVGNGFGTHAEGSPEPDMVDNKWEEHEFDEEFQSTPALLSAIQTTNNQHLGASVTLKKPWMVVSIDGLSKQGFRVTLDRCEAKDGAAVNEAEEIGYIALSSANGMIGGVKYSVQHAETSGQNMGLTDANKEAVTFHEDMPDAIAIASKATRKGGDGGWLRLLSQTADSVTVFVDEDTTKDAERAHMTEDVGLAAFSAPFSFP
jgi:hypothetical protein